MSKLRSWSRAHSPGGDSRISRRKKETESGILGDVGWGKYEYLQSGKDCNGWCCAGNFDAKMMKGRATEGISINQTKNDALRCMVTPAKECECVGDEAVHAMKLRCRKREAATTVEWRSWCRDWWWMDPLGGRRFYRA